MTIHVSVACQFVEMLAEYQTTVRLDCVDLTNQMYQWTTRLW